MPRKHIILPMHIWTIEDLSVTERLVGSVVYGYTEHGKQCFMTNTGLSKLLRVSRRTVSTAVNSLIDKGYIEESGGGRKRTLRWKQLHGEVEAIDHPSGKNLLPVIHKNNTDLNTYSNKMNEEMKEWEKTPKRWEDVRDYFTRLNDLEGTNYGTHVSVWAKEMFSYYEARGWKTKQGEVKAWRGVAQAWYRRSAKRVPQRAVQKRDNEQIRRDIKWHQRRLDNYLAEERRDLAYKESQAIRQLTNQLNEA